MRGPESNHSLALNFFVAADEPSPCGYRKRGTRQRSITAPSAFRSSSRMSASSLTTILKGAHKMSRVRRQPDRFTCFLRARSQVESANFGRPMAWIWLLRAARPQELMWKLNASGECWASPRSRSGVPRTSPESWALDMIGKEKTL